MAWSPDSKTLAVGTQDGTIVLWNLRTLRQIATLKAHLTYVGGLAFSPDGQILVSQAGDGFRVWCSATAIEAKGVRSRGELLLSYPIFLKLAALRDS
jgi:WD40 repeat protein